MRHIPSYSMITRFVAIAVDARTVYTTPIVTAVCFAPLVGIMVIFNTNIAPNSDRKLIVYTSNIPKTLNIKCTCQH